MFYSTHERTCKIFRLVQRKIQGTENLHSQRNAEINLLINVNSSKGRDIIFGVMFLTK